MKNLIKEYADTFTALYRYDQKRELLGYKKRHEIISAYHRLFNLHHKVLEENADLKDLVHQKDVTIATLQARLARDKTGDN